MKSKYIILSDLHLEFRDESKISSIIDLPKNSREINLILCGDIGYPSHDNYWEFLISCSENFRKVFLITGNHEYYNLDGNIGNIHEINKHICNESEELSNIVFLNNNSYYDEEEKKYYLGGTLWTHVDDEMDEYITKNMNDYTNILTEENTILTVKDTNKYNKITTDFITSEISKNKDKDIIVITHHLPSYALINKKYSGHKINAGFANNLEYLFANVNVKLWCYGHTHYGNDIYINQTRLFANPLGYPSEHKSIDYHAEVIEA